MAQGSGPTGRRSMHGRSTGDQPWVTPEGARSTRLFRRLNGTLSARVLHSPRSARHGTVGHPAADPLLRVLRSRPRVGEVVTREELREALGDSAQTPRYIETVAKRGYRFVAPVTEGGPRHNPLRRSRPARGPA